MTRLELLTLVLRRARKNGFEFRRWYTGRLGLPWISTEAALTLLDQQRRYYALLFSHDFACAFWKAGEEITFAVPAQKFERLMPDGSIAIIHRKPFTRRSSRRDAWRYHLREMALAEDPLRYLRKYLHVQEDLSDELTAAAQQNQNGPAQSGGSAGKAEQPQKTGSKTVKRSKQKIPPRPLPTDLPAFLRRPYP